MRHKLAPKIIVILTMIWVSQFILTGCGKKESEKVLIIGSWGGAYQEAQRKAFFEPFSKKFGVKIVETQTPDYAKIYEWANTGEPSVDVIDVETYLVFQAGAKGALEAIDYTIVDKTPLMPDAVNKYGVASCAYTDVMAWNENELKDNPPTSWKDFWDTEKYKGPRGFRDLPASTLEIALLADGVPPDKLYPLDVDRALQKLSELRSKAEVRLWSTGDQPREWLVSRSAVLSSAWNGRIYVARQEGQPLAMTFDSGMIDWLWWVVPKNAKHKDFAMKFIAFSMEAAQQAELPRHISYGPTNLKAQDLIPPEVAPYLPTSKQNIDKLIVRDNKWWSENEEWIRDKWRQWKLKSAK